MNKKLMILTILLLFSINTRVIACTAFIVEDENNILVGNNEDWAKEDVSVHFIPAEGEKFGRVFFVYKDIIRGGMNDKGLFFDYFSVSILPSPSEYLPYRDDLSKKIMEKCATVEDVLKTLDIHHIEYLKNGSQIFIADRTGSSAIIEGDNIIRKEGRFQIVTNFHQSKVAKESKPCQWYKLGCNRYKTALNMLNVSQEVSVNYSRDILKATHQSGIFVKTLYSNIYDLKRGIVYIYQMHDFNNVVELNLSTELRKGSHSYDLPSLFQQQ